MRGLKVTWLRDQMSPPARVTTPSKKIEGKKMKELEKMKDLKKLNILWVIKTDYIKMFYFFIKTLQSSFNFENWPFKIVFPNFGPQNVWTAIFYP